MDFASADMGLEYEVWKSDEGFVPFECSGEPLVVAPLASENPTKSRSKLMELSERNPMEVRSLKKIDNSQLSLWVINRIKAFKKSVGTSLEGFEEQVTSLFLALEERRKKKLQEEGAQKKMAKVGQKGHQVLKNLASTWSGEIDSVGGRRVSRDRAIMVHQCI